jgi:phage-related protein
MEIAERYDRNAYWLIYAVQLGKAFFVLHVFQKKSKSGIAIPKIDVDLIVNRYKEARERAKNE